MRRKRIEAKTELQTSGEYRTRVMLPTEWDQDGNVIAAVPVTDWSEPQRNVILPGGFDPSRNWQGNFESCHAGSGTTPNKVLLDGTFNQSGTTVTRASGTGVFSSGNVNDFIKFGSGERAKIVSFTNTLTVEVDRSQTISGESVTVYDTSRTLLDTWIKATATKETTAPGAQGVTISTDVGTCRYWKTFNFATEVSPQTYTEIGVAPGGTSNSTTLFSRVTLDSPVNVDTGQFLQARFDLLTVLGNYRTSAPITVAITGWPRPYEIVSITPGTSGGTSFDVVVSETVNTHYATGRPFTIAGALPSKTNITSISSTVSDFTVTTSAAHGKNPGDSIVIEGATPSGYNGTWTCAAGTTGSTIVVTSGINPGAGSGGTVRLATPGTWYDGTWTIASFPAANTIRVTDNTVTVPAGDDGTVANNLNAAAILAGTNAWYNALDNAGSGCILEISDTNFGKSAQIYNEANMKVGMAYGVTASTSGGTSLGTGSAASYNSATRSRTWTWTVASGSAISTTWRQILISSFVGQFWITFEERQRKDNGYQLQFTYTISWEPDLA